MNAKEYLKGCAVAAIGLAIVFGGARILEHSEAWCVAGNIICMIGIVITLAGGAYMHAVRNGVQWVDIKELFKEIFKQLFAKSKGEK